MHYLRLNVSDINLLWQLQKLYKREIGESEPAEAEKARLASAMEQSSILFFGAFDGERLIGCCSVTLGFSTFNYERSGVFEDFFILPEYRHRGIARKLVEFAYRESSAKSLTVGCAPCDEWMYASLGFSVPLGKLLAFEW